VVSFLFSSTVVPLSKSYGVAAKHSKALPEYMAASLLIETEHKNAIADTVAGGVEPDTITIPLPMAAVNHCN
jgi:threonine dehydratase